MKSLVINFPYSAINDLLQALLRDFGKNFECFVVADINKQVFQNWIDYIKLYLKDDAFSAMKNSIRLKEGISLFNFAGDFIKWKETKLKSGHNEDDSTNVAYTALGIQYGFMKGRMIIYKARKMSESTTTMTTLEGAVTNECENSGVDENFKHLRNLIFDFEADAKNYVVISYCEKDAPML